MLLYIVNKFNLQWFNILHGSFLACSQNLDQLPSVT